MTDTVAPVTATGGRGRKPRRDPEGHMPLVEHVRELRNRVAVCLVAVVAAGVWGWFLYQPIFNYLAEPYNRLAQERGGLFTIAFTGVTDAFNLHVKVALFVGMFLASPVWLYEVWAFIAPGLIKKEKRYAFGFVAAAVPLFVLGGYLATRVIPVATQFLVELTPSVNNVSAVNSADNVISFALHMILGFGIMFVIPVLLVGLNLLGVLPARTLAKGWRIAVLIIFVLSAIASPSPDPGSMLLLALPVVALFLLALGVSFLNDRRRGKLTSEYADLDDDEASPITPARDDD